jgi:hypothetical protein
MAHNNKLKLNSVTPSLSNIPCLKSTLKNAA